VNEINIPPRSTGDQSQPAFDSVVYRIGHSFLLFTSRDPVDDEETKTPILSILKVGVDGLRALMNRHRLGSNESGSGFIPGEVQTPIGITV